MKNILTFSVCLLLGTAVMLHAQPGPRGAGAGPSPKFDPAFRKLFGEHARWSSAMEFHIPNARGAGPVTMQAQMAMLDGKSRLDIDMTKMQGGMPPGMAEQIKAMGMAEIATITIPEKKMNFLLYPGLEGYVETPLPADADKPLEKFQMELTKVGEETIDGHACIKSKFAITEEQGKKREGVVWQAGGLKNFPLKIESEESGQTITMTFRDVKMTAPAATLFELPKHFKMYPNQQMMLQEAMMKRLGGAGGIPLPPTPK